MDATTETTERTNGAALRAIAVAAIVLGGMTFVGADSAMACENDLGPISYDTDNVYDVEVDLDDPTDPVDGGVGSSGGICT